MAWRIFQASIFLAVVFSSPMWNDTGNKFVAPLFGIVATALGTLVIGRLIDLANRNWNIPKKPAR